MRILFLCTDEDIDKERLGFANAFKDLGVELIVSGDVSYINHLIAKHHDSIIGIVNPEGFTSVHPFDLLSYDIPTLSFQIDTYTRTRERALAAKLYDIQAVFHPGYPQTFEGFGCHYPVLLGHAIDHTLLDLAPKKRIYDIGWVGRTDAKFYSLRRKILGLLQKQFITNDVDRSYNWQEMIEIYQRSKIVVNISRDDFLQDANMRCFEAMGAGSLLMTKLPTELSQFGFRDGEHFVGFDSETDLVEKVAYYLDKDEERTAIAERGKTLVLAEHTYNNRALQLIKLLKEEGFSAMRGNPFRKASPNVLVEQIAYNFWEDGELQKMLSALEHVSGKPSLRYLFKASLLFAKKIFRLYS